VRVLVVTAMYPTNENPNYGTFVKSQMESIQAAGVDIEVEFIRGHESKFEYLSAISRITKAASSGEFDLIHAHYGLSGIVSRCQFKLPVVVSYCGSDVYGHTDEKGNMPLTEWPLVLLQRAAAICMTSVIVKSRAMQALLPTCKNMHVIPNGVDFDIFKPLDRQECRARLGLDADKTYILFPYAPTRPRKNFAAIKAAQSMLNARRNGAGDVEILVVSDEPNERVPLYMNAANAMALASPWEGSPNAVKEALACDLPIAAYDVGDVPELLEGVEGTRVTQHSPAHLADALEHVLTYARSTGRANSGRLRLEQAAQQVINVYQTVLS